MKIQNNVRLFGRLGRVSINVVTSMRKPITECIDYLCKGSLGFLSMLWRQNHAENVAIYDLVGSIEDMRILKTSSKPPLNFVLPKIKPGNKIADKN